MHLESLITTYGYPVLFVGIMLEGEAFLILGAYLAHRGYFSLPVVIAVAVGATFTFTQVLFYLGDRYGTAFIQKRPAWQKRMERVNDLLGRYGSGLVIGFRALYGLRTVIPLAIGAADYPVRSFIIFNLLGALIWALVFALAGNSIAQLIETFFAHLRKHELTVAIVVTIIGLAWGLYRLYQQPKLPRQPAD